MEPTFTKTNRSIVMMRCLGSGCNVFFVSGSNVVFQTLDLAAGRCNEGRLCRMNLVELIEMAGTIRMTPEQAERQRRSFAYGNVEVENDSIPWEMIHRAAEGLEER
jgi:hypothetical protein